MYMVSKDSGNDTPTAEARTSVLAIVIASRSAAAHRHSSSRSASCLFLIVLADFPNKVAEGLVNVDTLLGGGLDELAAEMFCHVSALVHANLAFVLQITFISNDDHREGVSVLHAENLLVEGADLLEGVSRSDGIDEKEALARAHVLLTHGTVFLLASGIQDVEEGNLLVNDTLLAVRVFDSGIVFVNKVALNELNRQRRFADATATDDDELVLSEELCLCLSHGWSLEGM